jgi:hypothetical protein
MQGMILMYAGDTVGCKSKVQSIAHSSTEAEFVAACYTAKMTPSSPPDVHATWILSILHS